MILSKNCSFYFCLQTGNGMKSQRTETRIKTRKRTKTKIGVGTGIGIERKIVTRIETRCETRIAKKIERRIVTRIKTRLETRIKTRSGTGIETRIEEDHVQGIERGGLDQRTGKGREASHWTSPETKSVSGEEAEVHWKNNGEGSLPCTGISHLQVLSISLPHNIKQCKVKSNLCFLYS